MPDTDFDTVNDAVADLLEDDTAISTFMAENRGHFLLSRSTDKRVQDPTGRDCPFLKLQPEGGSGVRVTNQRQRVALRFKVLLASGARAPGAALTLFQYVTDCIEAEDLESAPLGISDVFAISWEPSNILAAHENPLLDEAGVQWEQALSIVVLMWRR